MPAFSSEAMELKALSQAIYLSEFCKSSWLHYIIIRYNPITDASHDPPEIHCVVPHFASIGDQVAIIGTRMHSREFDDQGRVIGM